jgi:hypothetical protein
MSEQLVRAIVEAGTAEMKLVQGLLDEAGDEALANSDIKSLVYAALSAALDRPELEPDPMLVALVDTVMSRERTSLVITSVIEELQETDPVETGVMAALAREMTLALALYAGLRLRAQQELRMTDTVPDDWT